MIRHEAFPHDPWGVCEVHLDVDVLAQSESIMCLANGSLGWRGTLDEAGPQGLPGAYLNGVHELRTFTYPEAGYGYPTHDEVLVGVANASIVRLMVDDAPLDVREGTLHSHERFLDFRAGTLERRVDWTAPGGGRVRVRSTRLVSLVEPAVAAVRYEVEAVGSPVRVSIHSEVVTNEPGRAATGDPRRSTAPVTPSRPVAHHVDHSRVDLSHRLENSGLLVTVAMDHDVRTPSPAQVVAECHPNLGRVRVDVSLQPGQGATLLKYAAHGWSADGPDELIERVRATLASARARGFDALAADQRAYLDDFWTRADLELDGDDELQQAARFSLFHVLQSGARAEGRGIAAKGLTGTGYDGHSFWDTEAYVLPVLTYTAPQAAADALTWRHSTLPAARESAAELGFVGAAYPWRTITGSPCSAYWPAGTAAFHVNADVADAVLRYVGATGDDDFDRGPGLEILVETARLWRSLGHYDDADGFHIDGVTGPDEYDALVDDNVYTNLMAQRNLWGAADAAERHPESARAFGVDDAEVAAWRAAASAMARPVDARLGVTPASQGFTGHQVWDFEHTPAEDYPLLLHHPYFDLYRKQVVKQADLVMAIFRRGDAFSDSQKAADFDYYESVTVRDSSLSASIQSVVAAEVGQLDLAYDYLADTALMDLEDHENNTRDGLHVASLAGTWLALVAGLAGMRDDAAALEFSPRLPAAITRLAFGLMYRGRRLRVEVRPEETTYRVTAGEPVDVGHFGATLRVGTDPVSAPTPPAGPVGPAPRQPAGRAPTRRTPPQTPVGTP